MNIKGPQGAIGPQGDPGPTGPARPRRSHAGEGMDYLDGGGSDEHGQ